MLNARNAARFLNVLPPQMWRTAGACNCRQSVSKLAKKAVLAGVLTALVSSWKSNQMTIKDGSRSSL